MPVKFKVSGGKELSQAFKKAGQEYQRKMKAALYIWGELLVTEIKENWVPVGDGILKSTIKVSKPQVEGGVVFITFSAGDAATPYAIAIHEHLSEHSPRSWKAAEAAGNVVTFHPAGRGPKFIQTPLMMKAGELAEFIAKELRAA